MYEDEDGFYELEELEEEQSNRVMYLAAYDDLGTTRMFAAPTWGLLLSCLDHLARPLAGEGFDKPDYQTRPHTETPLKDGTLVHFYAVMYPSWDIH